MKSKLQNVAHLGEMQTPEVQVGNPKTVFVISAVSGTIHCRVCSETFKSEDTLNHVQSLQHSMKEASPILCEICYEWVCCVLPCGQCSFVMCLRCVKRLPKPSRCPMCRIDVQIARVQHMYFPAIKRLFAKNPVIVNDLCWCVLWDRRVSGGFYRLLQ